MNENRTQTPRPPLSSAHREWLEHPITMALLGAIDARVLELSRRRLSGGARVLTEIAKLARGEDAAADEEAAAVAFASAGYAVAARAFRDLAKLARGEV